MSIANINIKVPRLLIIHRYVLLAYNYNNNYCVKLFMKVIIYIVITGKEVNGQAYWNTPVYSASANFIATSTDDCLEMTTMYGIRSIDNTLTIVISSLIFTP